MVLGLFKSKQKRIDEGRRQQYLETVALLEQLDTGQRGAIALHCATIRLQEMGLFDAADPEVAEMARLAWYDPLQADDFTLKVTLERLAGKLHQAATQFVGAAGDRTDMSHKLVLMTAIKAHLLTLFACAEPAFQPLARQIWALIATGFSEVEGMVAKMKAAADPLNTPEAYELAERIVADGPDGPEYRRIPAGFAPEPA